MTAKGVLPEHADAFLKAQLSQRQGLAQQDSNTRSALQAIDEKMADLGQTVRNIDPASPNRQKGYTQALQVARYFVDSQQALNQGQKAQIMAQLDQMPDQVSGNDVLDNFIALHNHGAAVTRQVSDEKKSEAESFKDIQQGTDAAANAKKVTAELPFVAPQARATLAKTGAETREASARADLQQAQASAYANDPQIAGVDPKQVPRAKEEFSKVGQEFAAAQAVAQRMNATMQAARSGNVVAYQTIPEEGTLQITTSQGVHRVNKTEIDQYAGGGSLWDRMVGHFGKAYSGQSIPANVLDDMARIQQIQADGARSKYENSLKVINQAYGSHFAPVQMSGGNSGGGGGQVNPPAGATHAVIVGGKIVGYTSDGKTMTPAQ